MLHSSSLQIEYYPTGETVSYLTGMTRDQCWAYIERHLLQIPNAANRERARQYLLEREENCATSTLGSYLSHLKQLGIWLGEGAWDSAQREDLIKFIKGIPRTGTTKPNTKTLGKYSKYQRMVMLREFYKWLLSDVKPKQFLSMPFEKPTLEEQMQSRTEILTETEIRRLISVSRNAEDRAIVMLLVDLGVRVGELCAYNIGSLAWDQYGATLQHSADAVGLKTGRRKVALRITFAISFLRDWLEVHPNRRNPDAPLFISLSNRNRGVRLTATAAWKTIDTLAKAAQIRHVSPHLFRHTAASKRSAAGWNEQMMRLHFGWAIGSDMPSYYSHVENDYDEFARSKYA